MTELRGIPAWIEAGAALIGIGPALGGITRARKHGWCIPSDRTSAWGLLIFGCLLAVVGTIRWAWLRRRGEGTWCDLEHYRNTGDVS